METDSKQSVVTTWVNLYTDSLFAWAFSRVSSREMAEDLVQETFIAAFQGFEKYEQLSNPKTWLFSILNHKISDHLRSKYRYTLHTEQISADHLFDEKGKWKSEEIPMKWHSENENLLDNEEFSNVLNICLDKLPPHWLSIIQNKYFEEKNAVQICQDLKITPTNLWQIVHRAKLQLRKCLEMGWFNT